CSIGAATSSALASTCVASTHSAMSPTRRPCGWRRGSRTSSATARARPTSAPSCATASPIRARPRPIPGARSMTEAAGTALGPVGATSAGRLLREARERQGLHIAALAASIKVTQKKLELLEADRFDALPDATFTRALAQTVCRALKIDPAAVLGLLPPAGGYRLEQLGEGLNAPFRERPGALVQRDGAGFAFGWVFWLTTLILVAAAVVYFLPPAWLDAIGWRGLVAAPGHAGSAEPARAIAPPPAA